MARNFVRASSQELTLASAPVSGVPLTLACWFNSNNTTNHQDLISICDSDSSDYFELALRGDGAELVRAACSNGSTERSADASLGYTANTWQHATAVFASSTSRSSYLDGTNKATNTDSGGPNETLTRSSIGRRHSIANTHMSGQIAEVGIWGAALTDDEIASLAKGYPPSEIRPQSLAVYLRLIGRLSPEIDYWGGTSWTLVNTPTQSAHPRIIELEDNKLIIPASVAPPATIVGRNLIYGEKLNRVSLVG